MHIGKLRKKLKFRKFNFAIRKKFDILKIYRKNKLKNIKKCLTFYFYLKNLIVYFLIIKIQ